jgi:hypothetical protein
MPEAADDRGRGEPARRDRPGGQRGTGSSDRTPSERGTGGRPRSSRVGRPDDGRAPDDGVVGLAPVRLAAATALRPGAELVVARPRDAIPAASRDQPPAVAPT